MVNKHEYKQFAEEKISESGHCMAAAQEEFRADLIFFCLTRKFRLMIIRQSQATAVIFPCLHTYNRLQSKLL